MDCGTDAMRSLRRHFLSVLVVLLVSGCASPKPLPSAVKFCVDCPEMILLPAGEFMMGDARGTQIPQHREQGLHNFTGKKANVASFYLSKYKLTRGDWRRCVAAGACSQEPLDRIDDMVRKTLGANDDEYPMSGASASEVQSYLTWLKALSGVEFRLPTSAEWEYAARAGRTGAYYWGSSETEACAYSNVADLTRYNRQKFLYADHDACTDGYVWEAPTRAFKPNAWGFVDMYANAPETASQGGVRATWVSRGGEFRQRALWATLYWELRLAEPTAALRLAADVRVSQK
jgi:formylglycine-generating enzyme required for sulfatase activity